MIHRFKAAALETSGRGLRLKSAVHFSMCSQSLEMETVLVFKASVSQMKARTEDRKE